MSDNNAKWGPWIEHDGRGCPIKAGVIVSVMVMDPLGEFPTEECVFRVGESSETDSFRMAGDESDWVWPCPIADDDALIIRYRIRRPRALKQIIEMVENMPAPSRQREEA